MRGYHKVGFSIINRRIIGFRKVGFHKIRFFKSGNRYEQLRLQAKELEANCKLISEAVESLIRIQSKNLDQQLFNKANEIQEEISRKRFDLRCAQIQLAGIRAQVSYN